MSSHGYTNNSSGPFSKNFIGADFGIDKTGIEKLKEAFDKNVTQSIPILKKKKIAPTSSAPGTYQTSNTTQVCSNHTLMPVGMRPLHSTMDSEAVFVCPNCESIKCIRVLYQVSGGMNNISVAGGGGGNYRGTSMDPFDPNNPMAF